MSAALRAQTAKRSVHASRDLAAEPCSLHALADSHVPKCSIASCVSQQWTAVSNLILRRMRCAVEFVLDGR